MVKGIITMKIEQTEDNQTKISTSKNLQHMDNPVEALYDMTMLVHEFLLALGVNTTVEAIMLSEAIRRNDWWGCDELPYESPKDRQAADFIYKLLRTLDNDAVESLLGDFLERLKEKEKKNESGCKRN